jgi:hypothetical protein
MDLAKKLLWHLVQLLAIRSLIANSGAEEIHCDTRIRDTAVATALRASWSSAQLWEASLNDIILGLNISLRHKEYFLIND